MRWFDNLTYKSFHKSIEQKNQAWARLYSKYLGRYLATEVIQNAKKNKAGRYSKSEYDGGAAFNCHQTWTGLFHAKYDKNAPTFASQKIF